MIDSRDLYLIQEYDVKDKTFKEICETSEEHIYLNHGKKGGVSDDYVIARGKLMAAYPALNAWEVEMHRKKEEQGQSTEEDETEDEIEEDETEDEIEEEEIGEGDRPAIGAATAADRGTGIAAEQDVGMGEEEGPKAKRAGDITFGREGVPYPCEFVDRHIKRGEAEDLATWIIHGHAATTAVRQLGPDHPLGAKVNRLVLEYSGMPFFSNKEKAE
ncbi:MAG: hypothetical protein M1812_003096 [Candelaria pacifica]|nr:MAG: hypothetical protein M1812_003096 [Candelaria pacifica]